MNTLSILYTAESGNEQILLNCGQLRNLAVVKEARGASEHWVLVGRVIGSDRHARIVKSVNAEEVRGILNAIVGVLSRSSGGPVVFDVSEFRVRFNIRPQHQADHADRDSSRVPLSADGF